MNDTTNTTPTTDAADDLDLTTDSPEDNKSTVDVDVVLNDLEIMANNFSDHVQGLRLMQENAFFRFDELDETTKVAFRALKRVKRERVPDSLVDSLLVSSVLPGRL